MGQPAGDDATYLGDDSGPGSLDGSCAQVGPTPPLARRLGNYEIEEDLGKGAMGVVYRARDPSGRLVAIKVLRGEPSVTATQRFLREAEVLAKLRHPNVVRVHDRGSEGGELYMVMALIEGKSLEEVVRDDLLEPARAVRLAVKIARALDAAHAQGVIHRDIKPDNIRLNADGEPVLVDFGLASSLGAHSLTQDGQLLGTPYYMPPEQATGDRSRIGPASDIYSLGATLYRFVTGQPPFAGRTQTALLKSIAERRPPSVSALRPGLSSSLSAVIDRCLEKDPAARYPSAAALANALEGALTGDLPTPPSRAPALALVTLVAGLMLVAAALAIPGSRRDPGGASPAVHAQGLLPAPILAAPPPHTALPLGGDVELRWLPVAAATGYEVETARDEPRRSATTSLIVSATSVVPGSWRVRAVGPDGPGEWSAASPLEVSDVPGWLWPTDGAVLELGTRGELRWTPVPNTSGYELLQRGQSMGMPAATTSYAFEVASQLAGHETTFRVRALFEDRRGPQSPPLQFRFDTWKVAGAVEVEHVEILHLDSQGAFRLRAGLQGELSGGSVGWFEDPVVGDWVELLIPLEAAGRYRVSVQLYRGRDCGQVELTLGDLKIVLDGLMPENPVMPYEGSRVLLGDVDLTPSNGGVSLRLTVIGKAEASTGFSFGLDCVLLEPL
jgi:predicted Ser/Thr protein kinase